jgi:hypothetical protein
MTVYRDGSEKTACEIVSGAQTPPDGRLSVSLAAAGGFLATFAPPKKYAGW